MLNQSPRQAIQSFLKLESSGGILLVLASILALVLANSPLYTIYQSTLDTHLTVTLGGFGLDKPLLLWINDGLMAIFFLLVGLELKREIVQGQLSNKEQILLPALAGLGGLVVPALIYFFLNQGDSQALNGWAIPTATDIAFALAILSLLGDRVPLSLKIFLTTIAIIDDLAAIIVIAIFYSGDLNLNALLLAGSGIVALTLLNRFKVQRTAAYLLVGAVIWFCVLKSGVHATLAGVLVAAFIPMGNEERSPARELEHNLHPWVAFAILPMFAFANAGVSFSGLEMSDLTGTIPVGIFLGLFFGKQIGVFLMTAAAIGLGVAKKPKGTNWGQLYGVALLCGVGFTMSLFIGSLAFEHGEFNYEAGVKLGVFAGSLVSGFMGWLLLKFSLPKPD